MNHSLFVFIIFVFAFVACDETDLPSDVDCNADTLVTVVESPDFTDDCKYALSNPSVDYLLLPTNIYEHIDELTDGMTFTVKYIETPDVASTCSYGRSVSIVCLEN